ncbi:DNA topology modulation protein [Enterococcus sp. LJL98]
MKKIIIIGSSGAGKSTFSRKLSEKIGIPVFHLDTLLWKPNWEMTTRREQISIQEELMKKESWIIDGNYNGTMDLRINAADAIIFFDLNRWLCLYRVIQRYFQFKGKSRPDMQAECPEKLDFDFLKFIWNYPKKQKLQVEERLNKVSQTKEIILFKNKKQMQHFLDSL